MPDRLRTLRPGQSFVGLLMVLLILTLLTALAAPRVDLTRFRSDAMARQASTVFVGAARAARRQRHDVVVTVDSARKRIGTLVDRNGNGSLDPGEAEVWTALDPGADILDPPRRLPMPGIAPPLQLRRRVTAAASDAPSGVVFQRNGAIGGEFVLYLTSDPNLPSAWRAVHVASRTGAVQLWRFDGTRWTRGRT